METMVGTVTALRRYPVKSLLGEEVTAAEVSARGLAADRQLALVDRESGKIASAKNPRLWRSLLQLSAEAFDTSVRITLPDGKTVWSTEPDVDAVLSRHLGREVTLSETRPPGATLERSHPEEVLRAGLDAQVGHDAMELGEQAPEGTFFDFAPLHLLTRGTLERITELSPRGAIEAERYRPNIVIGTEAAGFIENGWVGRELRIGDALTLRVLIPTPRCAVPTLEHGALPRDPHALRVPAQHNRIVPTEGLQGLQEAAFMGPLPCAGVYARVERPGRVRQGDAVRLV